MDTFLKCLARIHTKGKQALARLHEQQRALVEELIGVLAEVLDQAADDDQDDAKLGSQVRSVLVTHGGAGSLRDACALIAAGGGDNYLPLLWRFYYSHRQALFRLARALQLHPTTRDRSVLAALDIVLDHERSRREWLPITPDLSFASEQWHRTVLAERDGQLGVLRRQLEVCVFSYLASELKTGDVFVVGSEGYADYREQLLPSAQCEPQVAAYCRELGFPETAKGFVQQLQEWLTRAAEEVDRAYLDNGQLVITDKGEPVLKRPPRQLPVTALASLEAAVARRLPERSVLDVLANVEHWLHWTRHFGPLAGPNRS